MVKSWIKISATLVFAFDLITLYLYKSGTAEDFDVADEEPDELHRRLLEVGSRELRLVLTLTPTRMPGQIWPKLCFWRKSSKNDAKMK